MIRGGVISGRPLSSLDIPAIALLSVCDTIFLLEFQAFFAAIFLYVCARKLQGSQLLLTLLEQFMNTLLCEIQNFFI